MSLAWDETLVTGISEIDEQHQEIFSRFTAFSDACGKGAGNEGLQELVAFLEEYTASHFEYEENAMRRSGFPQLSSHRDEHRTFMADFTHLKSKIGDPDNNREALILAERIMIKWLIIHIGHHDKALAEHLQTAVAA
ncbi:MAG: hemerythrin family protein [Geobacter sp.]|nr:hemerythrin family protein [Geobacter sp.]